MHTISTIGLVAAGPDATGFYTWLTGSPVRIATAFVAIPIIVAANRQKLGKVVTAGLIVIIGMAIMFGNWQGAAQWVSGWLGGGPSASSTTTPGGGK